MVQCNICMMPCVEGGGAPCGFRGACFHQECLVKLQYAGIWRCPHCNVVTRSNNDDKAVALVEGIADVWSNKEGVWCEKTPFIAIEEGLQHNQVREERLFCRLVETIVEKMKKKICPSTCLHVVNTNDKCSFTCFVMHHYCEAPLRFVLTLCRTAFYGKGGCILRDGYTLSARKSRTSSRNLVWREPLV